MSTSLDAIILLVKALRVERDRLSAKVAKLDSEIHKLQAEHLPGLKANVNRASEIHATICQAIDSSRDLFQKPRTITAHGYKFGLRKGSGGISWDDDAKVVSLIRRHFTKDEAELLIKTVETPIKKALEDLEVSELKKIGCQVEDTGDVVYVKPTDSAVDKLVKSMLKAATDEAVEKKEAA